MSHPSAAPDVRPLPAEVKARLKLWAVPAKRQFNFVACVEILCVICATGFALGLALVLDAMRNGGSVGPGLWVLVISLIARGIFSYINHAISHDYARRIIEALRLGLMQKALSGRGVSGPNMARMTPLFEETEALEGYYARFVPARLASTLTPLWVVAVVALASPFSGLILLFTLLPFVTLMALSGMATAAESQRQMRALSRLSSLFADRLRHLPLIITYQDQGRQTATVAKAADEVSERTLSVLRMAFTGSGVLEFFSALSVALIAVYCGFSLLGLLPFPVPEALDFRGVIGADSAFASAFFVLALAPELYLPLRRLSAAYHEQQQAQAAAEALMALETVLETPPVTPVTLAGAPSVRFDGVSVRFAGEAVPIIDNLNAFAPSGTVLALIGATGTGKSTLLRVLLGGAAHLEVEGQIRINERALTPDQDLSPSVSWMSQHTPILSGTIRDNLRLGWPGAPDAAVMAVCARTGLSEMIAARPEGLDTVLDERGSGLSGGERRRIGLARAILKPAPLLILDEPTADLDPVSEAALISAISDAAKGRTVIIATHSDALAALAQTVVRLGVTS